MDLDRITYITTILGTRYEDPTKIVAAMMSGDYTGPGSVKLAFLRDIHVPFKVTCKRTFYAKSLQMMRFYLHMNAQGEALLRLRGKT